MTDPSAQDLPEAALVALARRGHDVAFEELVRRRQAVIRGLLRRLSGDAALADDLAQEAFLQAWTNLSRLRAPDAFGAWLRQIAVNVWLRHARRVHLPMEPVEDHDISSEGGIGGVSDRLDLETALGKLRPPERLCVVLAYAEGMTHTEIAGTTGLPLGTVKSHVARAAAKMRAWLASRSAEVLT